MPAIPGMRWSAISSATWSPRVRSCAQQLERLGARACAQDPVALAEAAPQVARDRGQHGRLVVDGDDRGPPLARGRRRRGRPFFTRKHPCHGLHPIDLEAPGLGSYDGSWYSFGLWQRGLVTLGSAPPRGGEFGGVAERRLVGVAVRGDGRLEVRVPELRLDEVDRCAGGKPEGRRGMSQVVQLERRR